MALGFRDFIKYLALTYSFYTVVAISRCDMKTLPFKLQSQDIISGEKFTVNQPLLQESVTTAVNLSLSINDLNVLDIKTMDVEMELGMTQKWYDYRLAPDYRTQKLAVLGAIWQPKITFVVGNKCPGIITTVSNDETQFWRGTSNGSVLYSERFLVRPKCTKDLTKYPFDAQTCFLKIGSYRFTAEEVSLEWSSEMAIESRVERELGEFRLEKFRTYNETDVRSTGNFSVLVLEIHLSRYSRREVFQSFLPSLMFVKISYGALWMKISEIRARIFTCQFSLIGIFLLFKYSNYGVSDLTFPKALDLWFLICWLFALFPLAESLLIRYFHPSEDNSEIETTGLEANIGEKKSSHKLAIWIEKISCVLHPVALLSSATFYFAVFNDYENR